MSDDRRAVVITVALAGFVVGYALVPYGHLQNLVYDPIGHSWLWTRDPGPIPMGYYGMCLYGVAGALVAGALAAVAVRLTRQPLSPRAIQLLCAWGLTLPALVMAYFVWNNWP